MKKSLKIIISTILILLFLQQCTDINLIPAFVENKDDYKSMYFGVESDTFKVAKITDKTVSFITYDTINNYFIVDTGYEKMKVVNLTY